MKSTTTRAGIWPTIDQRIAVSVVYVAALFMSIMDVTIVNVALPTIGREFGVRASSVDVIVIGYLVSLAVFIPASGWIGDRFGSKRTLLVAIVLFTGASALCGTAHSLSELVIYRVLQGVGGGMLTPIGMSILYRTFPPSDRVRLASILMMPTAFAPALGPVLGGLLVSDLSWRWVFYVNVPIGAAACIFGFLFVEEQREARPGHFDLAGFFLAGIGLGSLMYGVSEGPDMGWGTLQVVSTIFVGVFLLALMVIVERRVAEPMVNLRLFSDRLFRVCNVQIALTMIAFFGVLFVVPLYYQDGRGLSALSSGLSTFPEALGVFVGSQVVSRILYPSFGPRRVIAGGSIGIAASSAAMALCGADTSLWWMRFLMFGLGYAVAHIMLPLQAAAFATISPASTGRASSLFNANRQLGGAIGIAILSTVIAAVGPLRHFGRLTVPNLTAYHAAFLVASAVGVVGAVFAFTAVHDEDAQSTRSRVHGGDEPAPVEGGVKVADSPE